MVDRGNCTFTKKANSAQNANASAILIINNQKGKKTKFLINHIFVTNPEN
jgi:hypothetical protein